MGNRELVKQFFHENEVRTNRLTSASLGILGILFAVLILLDTLKLYDLGGNISLAGMLVSAFLCCSIYPIAAHNRFDKPWIKRLITGVVVIASSICFFFFPFNANFLSYLPILLSAIYYDRKLIRRSSVVCAVLYGLILQVNVILETSDTYMRAFHEGQGLTIFSYPYEVMIYHYIPRLVAFFIVALLCDGIAKRGVEFVRRKAEYIREIDAMESELAAASEMQTASLPDRNYLSPDGNISVNAYMRPAKAVGGDFYDYFTVGDDLVFLIADVSDKGLPAALFMMKAKNSIRASFLAGGGFADAVTMANGLLCSDNKENMFITLWIASVNTRTGVGMYANCGHLPPIIRHKDGTTEIIEDEPDMMLGVFGDAGTEFHILRLFEKDTLVLFTDGFTDAVNSEGEHFGTERLKKKIEEMSDDGVQDSSALVAEIDGFVGSTEQFDDMTSLTIHFNSSSPCTKKQLEYPAVYESSGKITDEVNSILEDHSCPEDIRRSIDVAIDEVCSNISDHAYDGREGTIGIHIKAGDNYIELEFTDRGDEFDPLKEKAPDESRISIGGLGIFLYRNLMDEVKYTRIDGENHLRLTKLWGNIA